MAGLVVRREQMQALEQYALENFIARVSVRLRALCPRETAAVAPVELRALIEGGIRKAEGYGVTDEADVERYLEFVVRYGPNFDRDAKTAWAGTILRRDDLSGGQKMDTLDDHELFASASAKRR